MLEKALATAALLLLSAPALAQLATPRLSQLASVSQTIGTTEIAIEYHRPGVRERTIWGELVPYEQPWRMGANEATTIRFSKPVTVEGHAVPAGKYSFFAIPGRERWTLVLNQDPDQWGAYGYDSAKDQLRAEVTPLPAPHTEWMRFTIDPVTASSAVVTLEWERLAVPMRVEVDVSATVWSEVDETLARLRREEAQTLAAAAAWALDSGERLDEGLAWAERSIAIDENIFNLWTQARLLQRLGRSQEALPVMERSLGLARANDAPADFLAILEGSLESIRGEAP
jgi:tetratricopeptide (TPR) repeat protein